MKQLPTRRRVKRRKTVTEGVLRANPGVPARWNSYLEDDQLTKIDGWLDLVNDPPQNEGAYNFGIRNYRIVEPEQRDATMDAVSSIVRNIVVEQNAGIDSFDHHPLSLFLQVLETVDRKRIRKCEVCEHYFYANRRNKRVCSERCGTTARVRRHREKGSEYELNRKIARAMDAEREEQHKREIRSQVRKRLK